MRTPNIPCRPASPVRPRSPAGGQGMVEYIVIVALIALGSVVAVGFFGTSIKSQFVDMSASLVGESGDARETNVTGAIAAEAAAAGQKATLGAYGD